jgi:hypothetical protein
MRPAIAFFALAIACPAMPVLAQKETPTINGGSIQVTKVIVTHVFPLKYAASDAVAAKLSGKSTKTDGQTVVSALPAGIDKIVSDARTNSLIVAGDADAVLKLKKIISAVDVEPSGIRIQMKVLRFDFDVDGAWDVKTVGSPTVVTLDNSPATISVQGDEDVYTVDITPHKNADGSISVKGELRAASDRASFKRDSVDKASGIVTGVSNSHSEAVRKAASFGRIPGVKGEAYTVYYLQFISVK